MVQSRCHVSGKELAVRHVEGHVAEGQQLELVHYEEQHCQALEHSWHVVWKIDEGQACTPTKTLKKTHLARCLEG